MQASIYKELGDLPRAKEIEKRLDSPDSGVDSSLPDQLLQAAEFRRSGDENAALEVLSRLAVSNASSFRVWLIMGHCNRNLGKLEMAEACYSVCINMEPDSSTAYFCRGTARLQNSDFSSAKLDFNRALELDPADTASLLNRALANRALGQPEDAIADLTTAIDLGCSETRAIYIRYQLHRQLGHDQLAASDLKLFLDSTPTDEKSWLARGMAHMVVKDPEKALLDFQAALKFKPRSLDALQNIATVQAEHLDQTQNAIDALTAIIAEQPDNVVAIATRGVLYGRLKNRELAVEDAQAALAKSRSADTLYRVAGIYALTSNTDNEDFSESLNLLKSAALSNGGLVLSRVESDADLDNIRNSPEFGKFIDTLKSWSPKPNEKNR